MKTIKLCIVLIITLIFFSFQSSQQLIGKWEVVEVLFKGKKDNNVSESKKWLKFNNDSTLEGGSIDLKVNKSGSWVYNESNNELTLKSDNRTEEEKYYINKVNSDSLVIRSLTKKGLLIYFVKHK